MTRCEHIRELLPAHVDGALGAGEAGLVCAHLAECGECRREAERWARLDGLLETHLRTVEPVDEADLQALLARVHREAPGRRRALEPVRLRGSWIPAGVLAAAALVLALLGSYTPEVSLAGARDALLDEAATVAASSRELTRVSPEDAVALYAETTAWPRSAAAHARRQWGTGLGLVETLTRRVGLAPLAACLLALAAANLMVARGVRAEPRQTEGG